MLDLGKNLAGFIERTLILAYDSRRTARVLGTFLHTGLRISRFFEWWGCLQL